ncbi:hypothetical protein HWV62_11566 [Athelia sp. TMB]|nr:hypothetical protein HWV62_11566 [Athelia sp. TMB]
MLGLEGSPHSSASPEMAELQLPHPEFFSSQFFRQFSLQNPVFDLDEFQFILTGQAAGVGVERRLLAGALLAWATSFGLSSRGTEQYSGEQPPGNIQARTSYLVSNILALVDSHGTMRRPSWDGVRLLLVLWPLTLGTTRQLERTTMLESILTQVHALGQAGSVPHRGDTYQESIMRARVFWYAFEREGLQSALSGGRLVMQVDDLGNFYRTLPPSTEPAPSLLAIIRALADQPHSRSYLLYQLATRRFDITLQVATICHRIHALLKGPRAQQVHGGSAYLNFDDMKTIWAGLDHALSTFESMRESGMWNGSTDQTCPVEDVDVFVTGWQIFIFEIHNVIRESLRQRVAAQASAPAPTSRPPSPFTSVFDLHSLAQKKCRFMLPTVIKVLKRHLNSPTTSLIHFDARLIRDGCVFAALMLAQSDLESEANTQPLHSLINLEEGVSICYRVLGEMRWVFSASANARDIVMAAWDARQMRDRGRQAQANGHTNGHITPAATPSGHWSPAYAAQVYSQPSVMPSMQAAAQGHWSSTDSNPADSYYTYQPDDWLKYEDEN